MKIYTVHLNKDLPSPLESAIFVKEGFSFLGAILQPIWTLYNRMWAFSAILIGVSLLFIILQKYAIMGSTTVTIFKLGFLIFVGFNANDWYRKSLKTKGFETFDIVSASSLLEAKQKFLNAHISELENK